MEVLYKLFGRHKPRRTWLGYRRKLTPENIEEMRKLREQGWSFEAIARHFNVSQPTVIYHLNPKTRERVIQRTKEWIKKHQKRVREYWRKCYWTIPEFREKHKERARKAARERYQRAKKLMKQYPEYLETVRKFRRERLSSRKKALETYRQTIQELRKKYSEDFPLIS